MSKKQKGLFFWEAVAPGFADDAHLIISSVGISIYGFTDAPSRFSYKMPSTNHLVPT